MKTESLLRALGAAIRARREALGWSQDGFATELDLHRTYYGDIERGARNLAIRNLVRIADGLDVRPSVLLREAEARLK